MLIVDAGFLIALLDKNDAHHARALPFAATHTEGWITTWSVLTEATYFLANRVHVDCAIAVFDDVTSGVLQIWDVPTSSANQLQALMRRYRRLPMDLADASLVLLAEHLGTGRILTTDQRDFSTYRWKNRHPFEDVMAL